MAVPLVAVFFSVFELNLAGRLQRAVRRRARFLPIFKANTAQICVKLSGLARAPRFHAIFARAGLGARSGNRRFTMPMEWRRFSTVPVLGGAEDGSDAPSF
jgi:hypothetical protein